MDSLLFLAHRLPYPPNKGDKVRSYHFLKHLATRHRVFLGTFIDDPADWQHVDALRALCADVHVEALVPWSRRVRSAIGILSGEALTLPYFRSRGLRNWVRETVRREHITRAFAYSSPMAQYVLDLPDVRSFVDFVDLDSSKWGDYARRRQWPLSALYAREAHRLLAWERDVAARAAATIFVTDEEVQLFRKEMSMGARCVVPGDPFAAEAAPTKNTRVADVVGGVAGAPSGAKPLARRVVAIRNGVNNDYFAPSSDFASPFPTDEHAIVFTGAMDYWPNIDAVVWFAREVLPGIRMQHPAARFHVVGMNPDSAVRSLASDPAVIVTGRVDDVRPYLQHARVVVAPLRVARGIQNKVLEAMAMAKAVVVTSAAAAALSARPGVELEVARDAQEFAAKVLALMDPARAENMGGLARSRVLADYAWPASLDQLDRLLEQDNEALLRITENSDSQRKTPVVPAQSLPSRG